MIIQASIGEWLWLVCAVAAISLKLVLLGFTRAHYLRSMRATRSMLYMTRSLYLHTWHMVAVNAVVFLWAVSALLVHVPLVCVVLGITVSVLLSLHALFVLKFWYHLGIGDYNGDGDHQPVDASTMTVEKAIHLPVVVETHITPDLKSE